MLLRPRGAPRWPRQYLAGGLWHGSTVLEFAYGRGDGCDTADAARACGGGASLERVLLVVATAPARALAAGREGLACSGVGHRVSDRAEPQTQSDSTFRFDARR